MSSGGRGSRGNKGPKAGGGDRNTTAATQQQQSQPVQEQKLDSQAIDKDKGGEAVPHKIAPTAEQLRIAQMIDSMRTEPEKKLQEKMNQVMQFTGVNADDALVALHDCDNDVNAAIDALLEGDDQGKWQESTKKKKKPTPSKPTETESNKENRRVDSRERSGSRPRGGGPPRFRGRGGGSGRGGRDSESWDGPGRGEGSRRGRMTNGTPMARGRGGRGRGNSMGPRTFQNRQAPGFPDSIDTWGPLTDEKPNHQNNLKIDNWDDEPTPGTDDWDSEWTGSLDQTTVFGPSGGTSATTVAPPLAENMADPMAVGNPAVAPTACSAVGSTVGQSVSPAVSLAPSQAYTPNPPQTYQPPQVSNYSTASVSTYSSSTASTASITQPQTMDLAALLQKAAPQSTLTGLVSSAQLGGNSNTNSGGGGGGSRGGGASLVPPAPGLSVGGQHGILGGLSTNVGESLKAGGLVGTVGVSVTSPSPASSTPAPYATPTAQLQAAIFSSSGLHSGVTSSLASSISNNSNVINKAVSLSSVSASLPSRPKTQRPRIPQASKIPLSAVEMPEDAMAALDVQFSGLEFGTETFDFTADVKTSSSSTGLVSTTPVNALDPSASTPVSKDLTSAPLSSSLAQTQKLLSSARLRSTRNIAQNIPLSAGQLGPEPIPFPSSQTSERKPSGGAFVPGNQRSSVSNSAAPQGLSDLTKNETGGSTGGLGSLVGSAGPTYQSYTSSKSSTSFPSPPSAPYSQPPSQNSYTNSSQQGGNGGSSSTGYSNANSAAVATNSNNNTSSSQPTGGYGSSFSAQASVAGNSSSQYQNSYVNASSHSSLGTITAPKPLTGLPTAPSVVKDTAQSYAEQTSTGGSGLSSTLSTSASVSSSSTSNSTGPTVLSASLNSASAHPVQPSKPSVPGKVMSGLSGAVPPGVQQHQQPHIHQQQAQQHQHQQAQQHQQQQQQAQQMMAPHSQYVSPPAAAALQGALPPAFYTGLQQPAMYSLEDFQLLQQRLPHMQAPTSLATGRDGNMTSAAYSAADAKFRTDQNSSPVPSTMNQQGAQAGGTYITAAGNAAMPPFYMYHNMAAVPSSFPQYGTPTAIIQIPPVTNAHTGSNTNQFPAAPKLQYGTGSYYENLSQTQDFKTGYGSASQNQNKAGGASTGSATNSGTELGGYKSHLNKVGRSYDKQGFHTGTPPPFNLAGSGTNPMTANAYPPMFIPTIPAAAQHHSPLMHHQLHQDGGSSGGQRAGTAGGQNKGGSKPAYGGSYWGSN
ncbi:protein lingerer isoform X3 [Penaeus vannamei]|uniref:protein lingerer isoform X3 n=1 Tax=Penaeus vannamei TaxID=6689 RepID=UPI00387F9D5F